MGDIGSGACWYNSVCRFNDDSRPICECPQGFSLLDSDDKYGSCKPSFVQSCDVNEFSSSAAENRYEFLQINDTDWPTSDYEHLEPISELECRKSCLDDCFCAVVIYRDKSCWKKKPPVLNGKKDSGIKALVKIRKGDLPTVCDYPAHREKKKKDQGTLILVGSVLLGSSVFVNFIIVGAASLGFFCIYNKKTINLHPHNNIVETICIVSPIKS